MQLFERGGDMHSSLIKLLTGNIYAASTWPEEEEEKLMSREGKRRRNYRAQLEKTMTPVLRIIKILQAI